MDASKADLILHPIRLRIIVATAQSQGLTAEQIGALLPDVAQATLYRHLNKLLGAGLLTVVEERRVRGTVEKVYALGEQGAILSPADLAQATREDHMRYFTTFVASLLGDFARYLQGERIDVLADGVSYRQYPLYLSDEELSNLREQLSEVLRPVLAHQPAPGRRRRLLSVILLPTSEESQPLSSPERQASL